MGGHSRTDENVQEAERIGEKQTGDIYKRERKEENVRKKEIGREGDAREIQKQGRLWGEGKFIKAAEREREREDSKQMRKILKDQKNDET